jgi:ATP-dependent Clp protease adaptor protein ClpS
MTDLPQRRENGDLILQESKPRLKRPPLYRVLLLNDDYTPMEFVVGVLQNYFRMEHEKAVQIMMHVHQKGVGICGLFPREIAETKVEQVMALAQEHQHPLQCTMEPEHDDVNEDFGD